MNRKIVMIIGFLYLLAPLYAAEVGTRQRVEADIRFLADDLLEGRGTPGRGLDVAALFLAESLRAAGWRPGMGENFLQPYEIREFLPSEAHISVMLNGFKLQDDELILNPWSTGPDDTPMVLPLVFAGQGVVNVVQGLNPYRDIDLREKAVVTILGAPWELDPLAPFGYDRAVGKSIEIMIRNADLLIYVSHENADDSPVSSAEVALTNDVAKAPAVHLVESEYPTMGLGTIITITPAAFDRTLAVAVGASYAELRASGENGPARQLDAEVELVIDAETHTAEASNVIGLLPGTDPELADEWVVLTAHYDHLGINPNATEGEDGVWNGADDNASGTAALLEIARRLGQNPPARSVMILFVSGEERGILGSGYYSQHPVIPYEQIVLDINVDMVGRSTGSVQGLVVGSPDLFEKARSLGEKMAVEVLPDQQETWRLAYLTDSYHFDRFDVPAIEFFTGLHADYHQPSDEVGKIRFDELGRILEVMYALTRYYADGGEAPAFKRPAWFLTPD